MRYGLCADADMESEMPSIIFVFNRSWNADFKQYFVIFLLLLSNDSSQMDAANKIWGRQPFDLLTVK